MSTDRELLELAARAAGHNVRWHEVWQCFVHCEAYNIDNPPTLSGQRMVWVPLNDDGDALRLAVRLQMQLRLKQSDYEVSAYGAPSGRVDESVYGDPLAATRRAIVRAAAEIGRSMP